MGQAFESASSQLLQSQQYKKHGGSPIQPQRSFQENEKEVIVAGPAPKCHHREADSAEGG